VKKPQGYRKAAVEQCACFLLLCLPYYQALLFAGISGMVSALLLACLLLFVIARSPDIFHTFVGGFKAVPLLWAAPVLDCAGHWISVPSQAIPSEPSLSPSFQRPPPIFS
jgi:hypothetical protein